jgi:long-chain acyl-CoA synthetase
VRTIWSLWQDALAEQRTRPAYLVEENGSWREVSQAEAAAAVDELAHGLLALGVKKGDAFGIVVRTRLEWALFDLALAQIGAVAAGIYPSSTPAESRYILEHSNAVGCLVDGELRDKIEGAKLEHVFETERLDELRARGREHAETNPDAVEQARALIGDDDLFTFIYTSGTTGPPKACMILNRNYYDMVGRIDEIESFFLPTDVMLLYLPLAHNFGRLMHLLGAHLGYTIAFVPDPRRLGEVMPRVRPTVLPTVPRVLEKVHTAVSANFAAASGVKRRLIDWALDVGGEVSERRQRQEPVPAGLAFKHRIADRLVYSKVKERLGGRLRAAISGGAPLAKEIAEFFHTLDILILEGYGQTEENGFLTVTDRKKDILVTAGGKNVSPQNIENLLKAIPWVSQALVVGDRRPYLVALITLDQDEVAKLDGSQDVHALVAAAVERINEDLAHYEQVRRFEVLERDFSPEQNEVTPTLKLKRRIVEEHFADELKGLYTD